MKKIVWLAVLLLTAIPAWATTTVTGKLQNLGTGNVTANAFMRFWLRGCGGNQPRVNGTSIIAPSQGGVYYFDLVADSSGNISGTLYSTRDSTGLLGGDIECGGSKTAVWYGMQAWVNGKAGPEIPVHAKNGVTLDITQVTPLTSNPVVTAPTGDSTYLRLDNGNGLAVGEAGTSANNAFTGNNTHSGTETFTNIGVFTNTQMNLPLTSSVNGLNFLTEFQIAQGANFSTDGFAAGVNVPVGSTVYQANGISGYVALGSTATHAGVGGNFICNAKLNGVNCFGANPIAEDIPGLTSGVTLTGTEVDTGPQNAISAYSGVFGITSVIGGTSTSWTPGTRVAGSSAFKAGSNAVAQNRAWSFGFATQDQAVIDAAFLSGATCASSGTCNSQGLQFNSYNSGVLKSASITSTNTGNLLATPVSSGFFFVAAGDGFAANEGMVPSFNTSFDALWGDSVAHRWKMSNNGGTATNVLGASDFTLTLKKGSGGGNYTNATTSYTVADSTNLCYTVTIPTGWKLGISASGYLSTATAAVVAQAALTDNAACSTANAGVLVETAPIQGAGIGVADGFALNWVITGDGAAHNIALQFKTSNAADTASLINSSATITPTIKFELMPSN